MDSKNHRKTDTNNKFNDFTFGSSHYDNKEKFTKKIRKHIEYYHILCIMVIVIVNFRFCICKLPKLKVYED